MTNELLTKIALKLPDSLFAYLYVEFWDNTTQIDKKNGKWLIQRDGLSLYSYTAKYLFPRMSEFEAKFERFFKINEGDTVVDIGACIGDTSVPMAMKVGDKGNVIAIEALPQNAECLRLNLKKFPNCRVIEKAMSNQCGEITFWTHPAPTGGSLEHGYGRNKPVRVLTDTLNNVLDDIHVDFLKVDVQGAEVEVLQGASKVLKNIPKIVVETHYRLSPFKTYPEVLKILDKYCNTHVIHYAEDNGLVYMWLRK